MPLGGPPLVRSKVLVPRVRSMPRDRLDRVLDDACRHRLALVVAPAGSGKTTLLAAWAAAAQAAGRRVAWYRAESTEAGLPAFLAYLQLAVAEALRGAAGVPTPGERRWQSVDEAVARLERLGPEGLLLVVDDLHSIGGTEAEDALARLVDLAPPTVSVAVGTRSAPTLNVSRLRLEGELLEVSGEDLRFRSWEVERLFRDFYGEVLLGDELGRLARRTGGWAAGLQLFHLASRGKSASERARLLEAMGGGARLLREYLARNVLDELPVELREFLVETCLLRRLSGPLCDRFLDRPGSARLLEELERRQVFTVSLDDGTYRYHEVLQSHLEHLLAETRGETAAREAAARAGKLLEEDGAVAEALVAYCRAERWDDAARLLVAGGRTLQADPRGDWLSELEPALVRGDPWLRLGSARRLRADGQWRRAIDAFAQAEALFGAADAAAACRTERLALAAFLDPAARPPWHWSGGLRTALRRDPLALRTAAWAAADEGADRAPAQLLGGLASLAAGLVRDARPRLLDASVDPTAPAPVAAAATIAAGLAVTLAGGDGAEMVERGASIAERAGESWLARVGRLGLLLGPGADASLAEARSLRAQAERDGDAWGELLAALAEGWSLVAGGFSGAREEPEAGAIALPLLKRSAALARGVGAATLEAWARALLASAGALAGLPDARETALSAESFCRASGVAGARIWVYLALGRCDVERAGDHLALAEAVGLETGIDLGRLTRGREPVPAAALEGHDAPPVELHLLGGFSMTVAGKAVGLSGVKPRPRAVLRLLALNAGRPVHREALAEAFWPEVDAATAARNVHVALSGLRKELGNGETDLLVRDGEAYRLALPPGSWIDVAGVEEAIAAARDAHGHRDAATEAAALRRALELATGELLPEDGPAEWVVYRREELRAELAGAARALAELVLADDPETAAEACATGLRLDPHHDGLWRLLIEARERAGDTAAAATARQGYARMLGELGVSSPAAR